MKVGEHTIYWPTHLIHDRPSVFDLHGVVKLTMRNGKLLTISLGVNYNYEIILCSLLLVLQLVTGEHCKHSIFTEFYYCNDQISFEDI